MTFDSRRTGLFFAPKAGWVVFRPERGRRPLEGRKTTQPAWGAKNKPVLRSKLIFSALSKHMKRLSFYILFFYAKEAILQIAVLWFPGRVSNCKNEACKLRHWMKLRSLRNIIDFREGFVNHATFRRFRRVTETNQNIDVNLPFPVWIWRWKVNSK